MQERLDILNRTSSNVTQMGAFQNALVYSQHQLAPRHIPFWNNASYVEDIPVEEHRDKEESIVPHSATS